MRGSRVDLWTGCIETPQELKIFFIQRDKTADPKVSLRPGKRPALLLHGGQGFGDVEIRIHVWTQIWMVRKYHVWMVLCLDDKKFVSKLY